MPYFIRFTVLTNTLKSCIIFQGMYMYVHSSVHTFQCIFLVECLPNLFVFLFDFSVETMLQYFKRCKYKLNLCFYLQVNFVIGSVSRDSLLLYFSMI